MIKSLDSVLKDYMTKSERTDKLSYFFPFLNAEPPPPPPPAERTCSTCSKTCDVGVKCWWCGNE